MTKWLKFSLLTVLSLLFGSSAFAQGALYSNIAWRYTPAGAFPASGATITICIISATGSPCSPTITVYQDVLLSVPIVLVNGGLPVCTTSPQIGCLDGLGNFAFYMTPGAFSYSVSGSGLRAYGPIPAGTSCTAGSTCPATSSPNTWSALQTFTAGISVSGGGTLTGTFVGNLFFNGTLTIGSGGITPSVAGNAALGTAPLPWNSIFLGSSNTQNVQLLPSGLTGLRTATFSDASGTVSYQAVEYCGATTGASQPCAKTVQTLPIVIWGDVLLNGAATQSITTLPFTDALYSCSGSDLTTAAGIVSFNTYASASVTIQESGGTNADHLRYACTGH